MIDGAMHSGCFEGANIVERLQSANRWDRLHISFFNLMFGNYFLQHIDIC